MKIVRAPTDADVLHILETLCLNAEDEFLPGSTSFLSYLSALRAAILSGHFQPTLIVRRNKTGVLMLYALKMTERELAETIVAMQAEFGRQGGHTESRRIH